MPEAESTPEPTLDSAPEAAIEAESTPDSAVEGAVAEVEAEEAIQEFSAQEALESFKKWIKEKSGAGKEAVKEWFDENKEKFEEWKTENPKSAKALKIGLGVGKFSINAGRVGTFAGFKILQSLLKFGWALASKKGKVSFKEGYSMGKDMFDFNIKKDKK